FALAATRHVETHADIAELLEHRRRPHNVVSGHAAAEAVQNDEAGTPFTRLEPLRHADDSRQLEAFGGEAHALFGHRSFQEFCWVETRDSRREAVRERHQADAGRE